MILNENQKNDITEPVSCVEYQLQPHVSLYFCLFTVEGLRYLQSPGFGDKKIVHRDIKPLNILISYGEDARPIFKISDFGTAKVISFAQEECHTLVGTPEYLVTFSVFMQPSARAAPHVFFPATGHV